MTSRKKNTFTNRAIACYAQVHNLAHIIFIYVWLWILCAVQCKRNTKKSETNCAISIEHNLKMGVRPIFGSPSFYCHTFLPILRFATSSFSSSTSHFFFLFSILCPLHNFMLEHSILYDILSWFIPFSTFTVCVCVCLSLFFICHIFVHNAHALNRYCCWFLWRFTSTNLFLYICWRRQHVTTKRNSNWFFFFFERIDIIWLTLIAVNKGFWNDNWIYYYEDTHCMSLS